MSLNRYKQKSRYLSSLIWQIDFANLNFDVINSSKSLDSTLVSHFFITLFLQFVCSYRCPYNQLTLMKSPLKLVFLLSLSLSSNAIFVSHSYIYYCRCHCNCHSSFVVVVVVVVVVFVVVVVVAVAVAVVVVVVAVAVVVVVVVIIVVILIYYHAIFIAL